MMPGHATGTAAAAPSLTPSAAAPRRVLRLHVMAAYFHAIRDRSKPLEFRLDTPYWRRRLVGRTYDAVEIAHGYPKADDATRRLRRAWRGVAPQTLTHPHFGDAPVAVLAIDVTGADLPLAPRDPGVAPGRLPQAGPAVKSPAAGGATLGAPDAASHAAANAAPNDLPASP